MEDRDDGTMSAKLTSILGVLAVGVMTLGMVARPVGASTTEPAKSTCPLNMFFGAHGVNEGEPGTASRGRRGPAPGGVGTTGDEKHWGPEINEVWTRFHNEQLNSTAQSVDYRNVTIDPSASFWARLWVSDSKILPVTNYGVKSLERQLKAAASTCPNSLFVLAGFSQGAWVIDQALRDLHSNDPVIFIQIAGAFLMGDPAWPKTTQTPKEYGVATHIYPVEGYGSVSDYFNNGLAKDNFESWCIADDPICHYDGSDEDYKSRVHIHMQDYLKNMPGQKYTYAEYGGDFLASRV
jgi:hypothetical protein